MFEIITVYFVTKSFINCKVYLNAIFSIDVNVKRVTFRIIRLIYHLQIRVTTTTKIGTVINSFILAEVVNTIDNNFVNIIKE